MNTKKLLGTIIGVMMFAALIAGATFAWLTFGVTVGSNVLTGNTVNFVLNYTAGSAVTNLPILDSKLAKPNAIGTSLDNNEAAPVVVIIKKQNIDANNDGINDQPDGHASIWLDTTTSNNLTKDGVVRWAICRDTDVETSGNQVDDVCGSITDFNAGYQAGKVLNMGSITGTGQIPLLSDARLAENESAKGSTLVGNCTTTSGLSMCTGTATEKKMLEEDGVSYFVYFWLDGETITNDHLDEQYDKKADGSINYAGGIKRELYAGYVYASATQLYK